MENNLDWFDFNLTVPDYDVEDESGGDTMEHDFLNIGLINELEKEDEQKNDEKEYFTLIYNGKPCKAWLFSKELIPDIDGRLFAQGWVFDGIEHHTIKVYMSI